MPDCIFDGFRLYEEDAHNYEGCPHKSAITEDLSDISEPRYDLNVSNLSFCKYGLTRHLCPHICTTIGSASVCQRLVDVVGAGIYWVYDTVGQVY